TRAARPPVSSFTDLPRSSRRRVMRFAVLGAAGQLGRDLCPLLGSLGEAVALSRADLDLEQPDTFAPAPATPRPDVLVNCAAYNFVDKAEAEPERAFAVNGLAVRSLASRCAAFGCRLVHFSTDYVFGLDAARTTAFTEVCAPGPVNVYGLSK